MAIDIDENEGNEYKIIAVSGDRFYLSIYATDSDIRTIRNYIISGVDDHIYAGLAGNHKVCWRKDDDGISILFDDPESWSLSIALTEEEAEFFRTLNI